MTVPEVSKTAKFFEQKLKENIYGMTDDQINETVDNLFSIFESTGALTLTEVKKSGLKGLQALTKAASDISMKLAKK